MADAAGPAEREWDVVGVGLGPFNLGLAALASQVDGLRAAFFEARPGSRGTRASWSRAPGCRCPSWPTW